MRSAVDLFSITVGLEKLRSGRPLYFNLSFKIAGKFMDKIDPKRWMSTNLISKKIVPTPLVISPVFNGDKRTTITGESIHQPLSYLQPAQVIFRPEEYEKKQLLATSKFIKNSFDIASTFN